MTLVELLFPSTFTPWVTAILDGHSSPRAGMFSSDSFTFFIYVLTTYVSDAASSLVRGGLLGQVSDVVSSLGFMVILRV